MTSPLPAVERKFQKSPTVFCRLTGRNSAVREYRALIVPTAEFCVIPKVDAYRLGYHEAAGADARVPIPNTITFASYMGYGRGTVIKIVRVDIGSMSEGDVEFLAFDPLQTTGFDMILGRSFLRFMHLDLDFASGSLRLERAAIPQGNPH